jgi:hypothetical protein
MGHYPNESLVSKVSAKAIATHSSDYSYWEPTLEYLQITEQANFVSVALIHNAGYIGGLIGLIACLILMAVEKRDSSRNWL